jgi:acetate kinase
MRGRLVDDTTVPAAGSGIDGAAPRGLHRRARAIHALGHRIVHGGTEFTGPVRVDGRVHERLAALTPLHQPKCSGP